MNPVRAGLWYSVAIHALVFGALGYAGYIYRPAELRGGDENKSITLTMVAAPADLTDQPAAPKPKMPPTPTRIPPPKPAKPPEPVKTKPPPQLTQAPPVLDQSVQDLLQIPDLPTTQDDVKSSVVPPAPVAMAVARPEMAPSATTTSDLHPRGDGSSQKTGEDVTTHLAAIGAQARPDYRRNQQPPYPAMAARRHEQGLVLLRVVVGPEGRAKSVELKQTSGFSLLDKAAIKAVQNWEFDPARVGGTAIQSEVEVPVRFKLEQ